MMVTYVMIPEEYWTVSQGSVTAFRDAWWMYVEDKGIVVARIGKRRDVAPQCNTNYSISVMLLEKGYGPEDCIIKQIPLVLLPQSAWSSDQGALFIPNAWTNVTTIEPKPSGQAVALTQALVPKED